MNNSSVLVHGVGTKGMDYPAKVCNKVLKEYAAWKNMLRRCNPRYSLASPTYIGVTCSENFKSYTFFYEWCQKQVGFGLVDEGGNCWQLDKDILVKGNKIYSEDTCVFVPARINLLLIKCNASRGEFPVGVSWHKIHKKFQSKCRTGGKERKFLGYFNTPQESFQAYKTFKETLIKEVANEYKDRLDRRAYEALMNYEVRDE